MSPIFTRTESRRATRERKSRPVLEGLESRTVLSATPIAHHLHTAAQVSSLVSQQATVSVPLHISAINLTNIANNVSTGVLTATGTLTGTILGQQFTTPLTATITPGSTTTATPILNLNLSPINLNVLGLKVATSDIDLNITAQAGGGLLGDLLGGTSGLAGLLSNAGSDLNGLLGSLNGLLNNSTGALGGLLGGVNQILGGLTGQASTPTVTTGRGAHGSKGVTDLVHLSVGPVDLNLLGLNVHLDNGANGPVTIDVSAQRGRGELLGNLLTSVSNLLNARGALGGAANPLQGILGLVENI